jgi:spore coat polysaccharide biosynthesis predicted glycosyltransferase SpsG
MKPALEAMNCWEKYKSYTATNNIPKVLRDTDAVISSEDATVEVEDVETATPEVAF